MRTKRPTPTRSHNAADFGVLQFSVRTLLGITTAITVVFAALPYPTTYPALYFLGFNLVIFALAGGLSPPRSKRRI